MFTDDHRNHRTCNGWHAKRAKNEATQGRWTLGFTIRDEAIVGKAMNGNYDPEDKENMKEENIQPNQPRFPLDLEPAGVIDEPFRASIFCLLAVTFTVSPPAFSKPREDCPNHSRYQHDQRKLHKPSLF